MAAPASVDLPPARDSTTHALPAPTMYKHLHVLPIVVCVTIPLNVIVTYAWAVLLGHVDPVFPYVSDTGSLPPESCFFSLMLTFSAVLLSCCVYVQHLNLGELLAAHKECGVTQRTNASCTWVGIAACLGLCIVAAFQEYNVFSVHLFGAAVCFVGATIYFCWQTWFNRKLRAYYPVTPALFRTRVFFCMLMAILLPITFLTAIVAISQFDGESKLKWQPQDGGWHFHVVSTASEWLMCTAFCGFILTFVGDFRRISVADPAVECEEPPPTSA